MLPRLSKKTLFNPLASTLGGEKGELGDTPKPSAGSVLDLCCHYADDAQIVLNPLGPTLPDPVMARSPCRDR